MERHNYFLVMTQKFSLILQLTFGMIEECLPVSHGFYLCVTEFRMGLFILTKAIKKCMMMRACPFPITLNTIKKIFLRISILKKNLLVIRRL